MKFWVLALVLLSGACQAAETLRAAMDNVAMDNSGTPIRLAHTPRRIVSLAPHATELLFAIGAGSRVVATDSASDYPEAARSLPRVAGLGRVNFEALLALRPDFALGWDGMRASDLHRLRALGVPVFVSRIERLEDVPRLMRTLGKLLGSDGEQAARGFEAELARAAPPPHPGPPPQAGEGAYGRPRVLVQIWSHPLISVNGAHWISDMLARCGARNVFADAAPLTPTLSSEAALAARPDIVLAPADDPDAEALWRRFPDPRRRVVRFDPDLVSRPGPRLARGAVALCAALNAP
jgi:iron complex transport system substrate-binding protein